MRFLCLHGSGTNAEIFKLQLAALVYALREDRHEFEFIEGTIPCLAAEGVQATFPEQATFFEYFDASRPQTILDAVKQVHELLAAEDPLFDGVIGFSQGAMLAATILIDQSRDPSASLSPPLKCAMLACAPLPFDIKRECRFEPGDENPKIIRIPTFHVVGRQDEYYQESIGLSRLCDVTLRQIYDHGGGHEIPKKTTVTDALADGLRKCVVVADMRQ